MRKNMNMKFRALLVAAGLACGAGFVQAQAVYPSAEAAADALATALARTDRDAVRHVLGANFMRYVPAPEEVDMDDIYAFLEAWSKSHKVEEVAPGRAELVVGQGWHFPVPIAKVARGWQFDLPAGQVEMLKRRIGRNELDTIAALKSLCQSQEQYARAFGQGKPASRIVSTIGKRDGLYWPSSDGLESPFGPDALVMGSDTPADAALNGYYYRLLPGAANGCGFVAWPARYGSLGVHSFVIGPDAVVRERDLGASSSAAAGRIRSATALGDGWTAVQ
jgi:hypothetical protein